MKKLLIFVLALLFSFVSIIFAKEVSTPTTTEEEVDGNEIAKILVGEVEKNPLSFSMVMTAFGTNSETVLNAGQTDYITKTETTSPVLQLSVQYKVRKFAFFGTYSLGSGKNQELSSANLSGNVYISTPVMLGVRYYGIEDDNFKMFVAFGGQWSYIDKGGFAYTTYTGKTIDTVDKLKASLNNNGLSTFCQIGIESRIRKFLWLTLGITLSGSRKMAVTNESVETLETTTWTGIITRF